MLDLLFGLLSFKSCERDLVPVMAVLSICLRRKEQASDICVLFCPQGGVVAGHLALPAGPLQVEV